MWETIAGIFSSTNIIGRVDNLHFSDAEKAEHKIKLLRAFEPFKVAQRILTTIIALLFSIVLILELILTIIGIWYPQTLETISIINSLDIVAMLGYSFITAVGFYLGGGFAESFKAKK